MPELGTYGSVRGVLSNGHPYRDPDSPAARGFRDDTARGRRLCRFHMINFSKSMQFVGPGHFVAPER